MITQIVETRREKRKRRKFEFLLAINNPVDQAIASEIDMLIEKRQFTQVIRDGIRLVMELRQGKIDFLIERFPFVIQLILAAYGVPPRTFVQIVEPPRHEQDTQPVATLPDDIDDIPTVKTSVSRKPAVEDRPSWNFILQQAVANKTLHLQDSEIIEYGVKSGRIKRGQVKKKVAPPKGIQQLDLPPIVDDGAFDEILI